MRKSLLISFSIFCFLVNVQAQTNETFGPSSTGIVTEVRFVPSLADQMKDGTFMPAEEFAFPTEVNAKRRGANKTVPGKGLPKGNDPLLAFQNSITRYQGKTPSLVFDADVSSGAVPTDPTGAVGPNHYLAAWNSGFRIFDKQGTPLTSEASLATVLSGNAQGDPIILYDHWADRFIITEFDNNPNGFEVAICAGPDPVNDGWYVYQNQFTTGNFPDYTKFSIWSDGYYVTANVNNGTNGDRVWVVERDQMLDGLPAQYVGFPLPSIRTAGFYSPQGFNVTGGEMPALGNATIVYMQDDAWFGVSNDHLKLWTINVNWDNLSNSSISSATELSTENFTGVFDGGSFSNISQPSGPDVDCLQATIMNQAQFRKFDTHNSAIFNFAVDAIAAGEKAGIRWFELRQNGDGMPWSIYQEGTYTSPAGNKDAFSGSMAMDALGNIGMAYTTVSDDESIAIYYTGRFANDPLDAMTVDETLIKQGSGNNPFNRLADYVHLTCDPSDGKTFWHIAEYFNPGRNDVVGVFKIAPDLASDVGVINIDNPSNSTLGASEQVTITVRNYGTTSQASIPVSYQLDGGTAVNETMAGPIAPGETAQHTFTPTEDMSVLGQEYVVVASTVLGSDEDVTNDEFTSQSINLAALDLGMILIISPTEADTDPDDDEVTVLLKNFGGEAQSNFDISYSVNGATPVTEIITEVLEPNSQMFYTFDLDADMNGLGEHVLNIFTSLAGDAQPDNDAVSITIDKSLCQPSANCASGEGIRHIILENLDNVSGCGTNGYSDFTDLSANINQATTHDLTLTTEHGDQKVKVWIDFNDNFSFTSSELIVNNYQIAEDQGPGNYTEIIPFTIENDDEIGQHLMRVKMNEGGSNVPSNACNNLTNGETEDYMVNVGAVGVDEHYLGANDLEVYSGPGHQYTITFKSDKVNEDLTFAVYNTNGQVLAQNWVTPLDGVYTYELDMSYASAGAYLLRLGNEQGRKIRKIIVD